MSRLAWFGLGVGIFSCCACGGEGATKPPQSAAAPPRAIAGRESPPPVDEGLSQAQIIPVVEARYPAVRGCHTMQYGGSGTAVGGVMTVDLQIGPEGDVRSASVSDSSFAGGNLEECVLGITRSLRFPKSSATTEFSWKFRFRAPG